MSYEVSKILANPSRQLQATRKREALRLAALNSLSDTSARSNTVVAQVAEKAPEQPLSPPIPEEKRVDISTNDCYMASPTEIQALPGKRFAFVCMDALQKSNTKSTTPTRFAAAIIDVLRSYDGVIVYKYTKSSTISVETHYKRFCSLAADIGKENQSQWCFILSKKPQYEPPGIGLYRMALTYFVGAPEGAIVDIYAFNDKKTEGNLMIRNILLAHSSETPREVPSEVPTDDDPMFVRMRNIVSTSQTGVHYVISKSSYVKKKYVPLKTKNPAWRRDISRQPVKVKDYLKAISKKHKKVRGFIVAICGEIKTGKSRFAQDLYEKWSQSQLGVKFGVKLFDSRVFLKSLKDTLRANEIVGSHNCPEFIAGHPNITTQNAGSAIVVINKDSKKARRGIINIGKDFSLAVLIIEIKCGATAHRAFNRMQADVNFPHGHTVTDRTIDGLKTKETVIMDEIPSVESPIITDESKNGICYRVSVEPTIVAEPWYFNLQY